MKIGIASHIVLDSIQDIEGSETESLGGPACYGSIIAKTFNFDKILYTKVGYDFEKLELLKLDNIFLRGDQIDEKNPTTRFRIILNQDGCRSLFLLAKCSPIDDTFQNFDNLDGIVLSPVIDEITNEVFQNFSKTKKDKFIMLDPQGFLRDWNTETLSVSYRSQIELDLNGITAIKIDEEELSALTKGITAVEGMKLLKKKFSLEFVILTGIDQILLLHKNILYSLPIKKKPNLDNTGLGDILSTAFSCSYLKEKDPLWAFCFGVGSVIAALDSNKKGLEKVPRKINLIERNASYFYNMIKFKILD